MTSGEDKKDAKKRKNRRRQKSKIKEMAYHNMELCKE